MAKFPLRAALVIAALVGGLVAGLGAAGLALAGPGAAQSGVRPAVIAPPLRSPPSARALDLDAYGVKHAARINLGPYRAIPAPLYFGPALGERPILFKLSNVYQADQTLAPLFDADDVSNLCGPSSLANMLIYLREERGFPRIAQTSAPAKSSAQDIVRTAFAECHVDPDNGVGAPYLAACTTKFVDEGDYKGVSVTPVGFWATPGSSSHWAPGPELIRTLIDTKMATMVLIGWYNTRADGAGTAYVRGGGHWVALAGYDANNPLRLYVSNPATNYPAGSDNVSAIVIERVPARVTFDQRADCKSCTDADLAAGQKWQTRDLGAGAIGVIEHVISVAAPPA